MSSPSQHHHHPPPYYSQDTLPALQNIDNPDVQNQTNSPSVYDLDFADLPSDFYDSALDFDLEESAHRPLSAPFHEEPARNKSHAFHHSRNISLDDTYRRSHQHSSSIVSNSADPPSGTFYSSSANLQLSADSVPQLSSSVSNPSLLDSPHSALQPTATPGRRHKSTSISYTTPLRGGVSPLTHAKVGKTPLKGHRRSRSKASLEPSSAHLLASVASNKSYDALANCNVNLNEHNPFHNDFVSPRVGLDDSTPLATPAGKTPMGSQYFTPISHNQSFGGSLLDSAGPSQSRPAMLRRNDTLDSIKIEDQEDDACKQLRKAKSFTSFGDQSRMARVVNSRSGHSSSHDLSNVFDSTPELSADGSPPKYNSEQHPHDAFKKSASIDLLSPELVASDRMTDTSLKSYPASIDLAVLGSLDAPITHVSANMPSGSRPTHNNHRSNLLNAAAKKLSSKVLTGYPTASQIQKTSTTEDIAKFAESILQSDSKRPIYVQQEQNDVYDPKKKHKCPLCLARFQRPEHVKRHLKSHSTDKPFQCDEPDCGRRFNRKDNLKAHLKKIHGKIV
ncbi:uncharacterized protein CXQ87_004351 [Candidozyma duobushaemuli]|uniref:C2H2-type domain-containing protein n=1 Tax=Candidozyma duobushaemuli TaxID=1231522 RepID=A0A2V1AGG4_9ASCO|nr:uncharacterized protein CXQ87_004351 [[Candida] duobushaemulonis]PVH16795.1 hypothetical protein CXQ87_004351 [[Candida] duobushaemulonis]